MWIVEVVPIKRGIRKDTLTYFSAESIPEGALVSVPLRTKNIDAIVIFCKDAKDEKQAIKSGTITLRKVTAVKSTHVVPSYLFETARITAAYYRQPRGSMLDYIVPDFSFFTELGDTTVTQDAVPERLILQAPLEERITYYRTLIREAFAKKESLSIITPTITDCLIFADAVGKGVGDFVVTLHSDLSKKKLIEHITRIQQEEHPLLVVTTPSFASLFRKDTRTIIIEKESSPAYTTPSTPSYDFRVIIEILARTASRKLIMSDSLLRIETLARKETKEFGTIIPLSFRSLNPIPLTIIPHGVPEEVSRRFKSEQLPAFSETLVPHIAKASHTFCFAMRTGLATVTRCRDCGALLLCSHCDAPLVLYGGTDGKRIFICTKCKRHTPTEEKCGRCGSWNLSAIGTGTAFVEEELRRLYPDIPVFRMDREVIKSKSEAKKLMKQYYASPKAILVGTEMALYYMHEPVDESIIVSFDTLFNLPSYKTHERIMHLLLYIAEKTTSKLYIQTKHIDEPIIQTVQSNNYSTWYKEELKERSLYLYPPAATIIKLTWKGKESEKDAVIDYLQEVTASWKPDIIETTSIIKGRKYPTVHAILRVPEKEWSYQELLDGRELSPLLRSLFAKLPPEIGISINPENLL